ncbi:MAG: triose-phosphate isomerase [Candidatus Rehaiarchaeum fermentans]|nr:triose-phosphate isomerase [Candidatus Rehaiarchaeum fermentans]
MFIVNYKAYKEGIDFGTEIAKYLKQKIRDSYVAPPLSLLSQISKIIDVIAQHTDPIEPGASTGFISYYEIKKAGAIGSLINHSEHRLKQNEIEKLVEILKKNDLKTIVCVRNLKEAEKMVNLNPFGIAYEPPELIGGNVSVSSSKGEIVKKFVNIVKSKGEIIPIIGAGIKSSEDIKKGREEGAEGFLVASGVVNEKFKESLDEFARAF